MTKPEQLKGKRKEIEMLQQGEYDEEPHLISREDSFFVKKDVRSAVEWLKQEIILEPIHKAWDRCSCEQCIKRRWFIRRIDEAFEDVIEETTNAKA